MGTNLYFVSNGIAHSMNEELYEKEDNLQALIADNPQLLLRGIPNGSERLMLVSREFAIKDTEDGANAYSLDHLFIDQSGVPVLVEVKRSTDTRIRREVVAQMMDYASRARTWDVNQIREQFLEYNRDEEWIDQYDTDDFWQRVAANLKAEHMRLVFAADKIPVQLRTLITFMDRCMDSIEVYGVEVRQYKTEDATLLTSDIIEDSTQKEKTISHRVIEWNADSFAAFMQETNLGHLLSTVYAIFDYATSLGMACSYGKGYKYPFIRIKCGNASFFKITPWQSSTGMKCIIEMSITKAADGFNGKITEEQLRTLMTDIPDKVKAYSSGLLWDSPQYVFYDMTILKEPHNLDAFKRALCKLTKTITS